MEHACDGACVSAVCAYTLLAKVAYSFPGPLRFLLPFGHTRYQLPGSSISTASRNKPGLRVKAWGLHMH